MTRHIIEKELDADLMLYDTEADSVHVLNPTARRIYALFREGKSVEEMTEYIRAEFSADPRETVQDDVQACLHELRDKGLV